MIHPLSSLLHPQRVVVIGPQRPGSLGEFTWQRLQTSPVQAAAITDPQSADYQHSFASLSQLPWRPDLALITDNARQSLVECAYAQVPLAVVSQPGYQPTSEDTRGMRILQAGAYGLMRPAYQLSFSCLEPLTAGNIAILSQSGIVATALGQIVAQQQLGCSLFTVAEPDHDVRIEELVWLVSQDQHTEIIAVYIESSSQSRSLLENLAQLTSQRPVIVMTPAHTDRLWLQLLIQTGSLVVHSLTDFRTIITALSQPAHANYQQLTLWPHSSSTSNRRPSWRYASALRHLSGVTNERWLGIADQAESHQLPATIDNKPIVWLNNQPLNNRSTVLHTTGPVAVLHRAIKNLSAEPATPLSVEAKTDLRHQLSLLPQQSVLEFPYLAPWLEQAGMAVDRGQWLEADCAVDWQLKRLGWPLCLWVEQDGAMRMVGRATSPMQIRKWLRQSSGRVWVQPVLTQGWDLHLTAERHPQFGPLLTGSLSEMYNVGQPVTSIMPLSANRAKQLAHQLGLSLLADRLAVESNMLVDNVANFLITFGQLFSDLPELQQVEIGAAASPHHRLTVQRARLHRNL